MANIESYDDFNIGSRIAGIVAPWRDNRPRTVIVKRRLLGGARPNVVCLPTKDLTRSAKVISLAGRGLEFGLKTDSLGIDTAPVQRHKRWMVRDLRKVHEGHAEASGAELIYGVARFVAPRTVGMESREVPRESSRTTGSFLDRAQQFPKCPPGRGCAHEAYRGLQLDRLPRRLIVLGCGYVGLQLSWAFRRFGSDMTVIEHGAQLASRETPDISTALNDLFVDEGI